MEEKISELNLTDIIDAVKIIDYSFENGAFKGLELIRKVLVVRDHLDSFIADQTVNMNVSNVADALKIIDYACENGAYRGWNNIRQIISVRDKLDSFVESANKNLNQTKPEVEPTVQPEQIKKPRIRRNRAA